MTEITLHQFLEQHTQKEAAEGMGVNQSAVSQMVKSGRDVRLLINASGAIESSYEFKPIGKTDRKVA